MTRRFSPSRIARLVVMPALILLVAWAVSANARRVEARRLAALEGTVTAWCESAARGEMPMIPIAKELPRGHVVEALDSACRTEAGPTAWSIAAGAGPGAAPSAGRATHHVMIRVDGVDDVGLLFAFLEGQPVVVGYWLVP